MPTMPTFTCPNCGLKSQVGGNATGVVTLRCPGCSASFRAVRRSPAQAVIIPSSVPDDEPDLGLWAAPKPGGFDEELDLSSIGLGPGRAGSTRAMPADDGKMPCPFCDEPIRAAARKCKHCGEFLDEPERGVGNVVIHNNNQTGSLAGTQPGGEAHASTGVAAVLSVLLPGLGQIYKGQTGAGVCWMFGATVGYLCFIVPGLVVHILCIADAAKAHARSHRR